MGITTTESLFVLKGPACGRCGKPAPGGAAVLDANNKPLGLCCASGWRREELVRLVGEDPDETVYEVAIIGHDPVNPGHGASRHVLPLIEGVRALNQWRRSQGIAEYTGVTEKAVLEAVQRGYVPTEAALRVGFKMPNPLMEPSVPPPPAQPDPLLDGLSRPLGARRRTS